VINSDTVKNKYTGNGSLLEYPVTFPFSSDDNLSVYVSINAVEALYTLGTHYSVSINSDKSGGAVTFNNVGLVPKNCTIAILLNFAKTQDVTLTSTATVSTSDLEAGLDKTVQLVQMAFERISRCVTVGPTSAKASDELTLATILDAVESRANDAAAAATAAQVAEGRAATAAETALSEVGIGSVRKVWTLAATIASGASITLPDNMSYIVGREQLHIFIGGVHWEPGFQYEEVGKLDSTSTQIKALIPIDIGETVSIWANSMGCQASTLEAANAALIAASNAAIMASNAAASVSDASILVSSAAVYASNAAKSAALAASYDGTIRFGTEILTGSIASNATYTLPNSLSYVVGDKRLHIYLGGCLCDPGDDGYYNEIGSPGEFSTSIRILVATEPGWTIRAEVV